MSGVFVAVPFGVTLWGALLGWLVSPALTIVCAVVFVAGAAGVVLIERREA